MKRNKKAKFIFKLALPTLLSVFLVFLGFKNQNIDLTKADKITGIVEDHGIDLKYGSKGQTSDVFFIKLKQVNKKLGIYRMSNNYDDLIALINTGDQLTLYYYENEDQRENVNINLIQIERNNKVLINKSEFENKQSIGIYVGIGGLIATFLYFIYNRKNTLDQNKKGNLF